MSNPSVEPVIPFSAMELPSINTVSQDIARNADKGYKAQNRVMTA